MTETTASPGALPVTTSSSGDARATGLASAPVAATAGAGDGAVVHVLELVGAVPAEADRALPVHRHAAPGCASASPPTSPSTGSTSTVRSMPATRASCSATRKALSRRCAAELHVLEVAAPAAPRAGVRAGRGDPVRRGRQDLDGVGPQVRGGGGGDPGDDPLTREGVAHEDDPPVGRPAHAAAAGGDGADLELQESGVARQASP